MASRAPRPLFCEVRILQGAGFCFQCVCFFVLQLLLDPAGIAEDGQCLSQRSSGLTPHFADEGWGLWRQQVSWLRIQCSPCPSK